MQEENRIVNFKEGVDSICADFDHTAENYRMIEKTTEKIKKDLITYVESLEEFNQIQGQMFKTLVSLKSVEEDVL